jgi:hypothetical protein
MGRSTSSSGSKYGFGDIIDIVAISPVISNSNGTWAQTGTKILATQFPAQGTFNSFANSLQAGGNTLPTTSSNPLGSASNYVGSAATNTAGTVTVMLFTGGTVAGITVMDSSGTSVLQGIFPVASQYVTSPCWDGTKFRAFYSSGASVVSLLDSCMVSTDGRIWTYQALTNFPKLKITDGNTGASTIYRKNSAVSNGAIRDTTATCGVVWMGARWIAFGGENESFAPDTLASNVGTATSYGQSASSSSDGITWTPCESTFFGGAGSASGAGYWRINVTSINVNSTSTSVVLRDTIANVIYTRNSTDGGITWSNPNAARGIGVANVGQIMSYTANGKFFAFGGSALGGYAISISTDGVNWNTYPVVGASGIYHIAYGNGLYVTNLWYGTTWMISYSVDGINWKSKQVLGVQTYNNSISLGANQQNYIAFGNGLFVASTYNGTSNVYFNSPDGINWTVGVGQPGGAGITLGQILFNPGSGYFKTVSGNTTTCHYSADGKTWNVDTALPTTPSAPSSYPAFAVSGTTFVVLSAGANYYTATTNGWTTRTHSGVTNTARSLTYASTPGLFAAVSGGSMYTSPDGVTWTNRTFTGSTAATVIIVATPTLFAAYPYNTASSSFAILPSNYSGFQMSTSSNGTAWTNTTAVAPTDNFAAPLSINDQYAYANGIYVALIYGNTYATSTDSVNWTIRTYNVQGIEPKLITSSGTLFVAATTVTSTLVMTSSDGITWTNRTIPSTTVNRLDFAPGGTLFFISTNSSTQMYSSSDGITWNSGTYPGSQTPGDSKGQSIAFGAGKYVIPYTASTLAYSSNGTTWTNCTGSGAGMIYVAFYNGLFWAFDNTNASNPKTSADGITFATNTNYSGYNTGQIVAGSGGQVMIGVSQMSYDNGATIKNLNNLLPGTLIAGSSWPKYVNGYFSIMTGAIMSRCDGYSWSALNITGTDIASFSLIRRQNGNTIQKSVLYNNLIGGVIVSTDNLKSYHYVTVDKTIVANSTSVPITCAAYFSSVILAVQTGGRLYRSTDDGVTFAVYTLTGLTGVVTSVLSDATRMYIFSNQGEVITSTDGSTWTRRLLPLSTNYPGIAAEIAAASSSSVMVSAGTGSTYFTTSDSAVTWKASNELGSTAAKLFYVGTPGVYFGGTDSGATAVVLNSDITNGYASVTLPSVTALRTGLTTYIKAA